MAVIQEDPSSHHRHVHPTTYYGDPNHNHRSHSTPAATAAIAATAVATTSITTPMSTVATPSPQPTPLQVQRTTVEEEQRTRAVDRNWARVRQKMIGNDSITQVHLASQTHELSPTVAAARAVAASAATATTSGVKTAGLKHINHSSSIRSSARQHSDLKNQLPLNNSLRPTAGQGTDASRTISLPTDGLGTVSTGIRGVLGFRTVVVQRTQLRKMEKEIEKALSRLTNEQSQPRSRTVARIGTGTRGMIAGTSYNLIALQEPNSVDRNFVEEMSETLTRWRSLTVEVPFKTDILRAMSKMLQADRPEPLSRLDSTAVLDLFDQMRQLYPLQAEPEDLQDLLWCLSLLSPKYTCKKDRVIATVQELLKPNVLVATVPLSHRNIQAVLASIILLLSEQAKLPQGTQDGRLQRVATDLMERIRGGDLGVRKESSSDGPFQEHLAQIAFLQGLIECLRLRDQNAVHYLIHEMIPNYWVEPVSKFPMTMDGPIGIFGQAASELVLTAPVAYADGTELTKSLILDLTLFLGEYLPPAGLSGRISKETVALLVRFILVIFSIEYLEDQQQQQQAQKRNQPERSSTEIPLTLRDDQDATPRGSTSTEREFAPRTPPRSPLSPNVSGENFQSRSLPPHVPNIIVDEQSNPVVQKARNYFDALWENGYQDVILEQLKKEAENISLRRLINLYHRVVLGSGSAMSSPILAATLNMFFSKLVAHQPEPDERLSKLLLQLSVLHRAAFYKPMIACVASDSTQFVTDYLCILSCLEMHMGLVDLYMRDADMICVIAMTDVGPERPRSDSQTQALKWGSCTIGQCVIVLEFIYAIKRMARSGDKYHVEVGKMFLIDLERKLGLYLASKEKRILVPRPMRVMLCLIFYEIRMLCKTIHRPGWLPRVLNWAINHDIPAGVGNTQGGPHGISETMRLRIKHIYSSVDSLVGERKDRYTVKIKNPIRETRTNSSMSRKCSTMMDSSKTIDERIKPKASYTQPKRLSRMPYIRMDETVAVLKLLITVHSAIHVSEYLQLIDPLWNIYCLESRPKVASSSAFLFVKCADLAPKTIYTLISRDLTSEDPFKRLSTVERLSGLFDHRNELLLQPYVIDPSAKGPFRTSNVQVPFVSSEVGSNRYTMDEPRWLTELKSVGNFPVDIRNRFEELGWGERGRVERELTRRAQTPLMLSWTGYLDEDFESKANFGKTYTLSPKDRHATVLVPVLNSLNMATIDLLDDRAIGVRSAAINFLSNYIRNEPVMFVRWLFADMVQARPDRQKELIYRLHLLLSASSTLPPGFAFTLFNHLLGLLKWYQRSSKPIGLEMMATLLPLLADVVSSTNDIVFKDFKRNKVDVFFASMGRFWFRPSIMPESMFPNRLNDRSSILPQLGIPQQLFQMTVVNINQIQFMTSFLVRFPLEASDIKSNIGRFNRMPRLDASEAAARSKLEDSQYLPDVSKERRRFVAAMSYQDRSLRGLSSLRARAWLCFVLNLIQRMEATSTERLELMNIFNGVNVILLEHGEDLGIVGQALDVYVTAASHLRRFFASQNGYMLIFPALFKVYCDSATIRVVQDTIDAAFYRFYLLHQEAFLLQSLGAIVPLMLRHISSEQSEIMGRSLFSFLEALDQPTTTYQSKALGVQSLSEPYRESGSYGGPQLEIPDWMSSFISKDSKLFQSSNLLHKQEFSIADSIKLFLAVIAFDPGSVRSEQFVRVLQTILPYFLEREPQLTTSGLDSLIEVFSRFARSSKPLVPPGFVAPPVAPRQSPDTDDSNCDSSRFALFMSPLSKIQAIKGKTWAQNDRVAIKHEFLCLIQTFCEKGGQLADSQHQQMAVLIRSIVKDYTSLKIPCTTEWIRDYIQNVVLPVQSLQQSCRAVLYLIVQFSNALRTHYKSIDFTGFLKGLLIVAEDDKRYLRASTELSNVFREKLVNPALALSVKGEWITDCVQVSQAQFCSSLVDLMLAMINNADTDTIAELEQASPTPRLMAFIIIPMCLRFKTRFHSNCLDILEMQFWLRMLGLTVKAAEYDQTLRRSSRTAGLFAPVLNVARVGRKRTSFEVPMPMSPQQHGPPPSGLFPPATSVVPPMPGQSKMASLLHKDEPHEDGKEPYRAESTMNTSPGLLMDFIALRIIIVRGERYLSYHPGCWLDIFNIVKKYFSAHAFIASSFSGTMPAKHARQNSSNGSGPSSPNPMASFPTSPRADAPRTSDFKLTGAGSSGGLSPFPGGFFRSSGEIAPFTESTQTKENVPTTALGYMLWSFAETIIFNRLPLMIMMRPFLLDQLRLQDYPPQTYSALLSRSASSSGPNSPAFYWPSPAMLPSNQPISGSGSSPWMSHLHLRSESGANDSLHSRDPAVVKQQQRADRRKQWRSWSKPMQTMSAFTAIEKPLQGLTAPMSTQFFSTGHRQRSFMSTSEHGGSGHNAHSTPRNAIHNIRRHHMHQHSESENNKAEHVLPNILVDRANRSMEHVRLMISTTSDGKTAFSDFGEPIYPEKRTTISSTAGLSPSMARHDRRDSSQLHFIESNQSNNSNSASYSCIHINGGSSINISNDQQFLLPGKYERQPVSPGFGSMFLAREAALKAPSPSLSLLPDAALQGSSSTQHSMTLTVPISGAGSSRAAPNVVLDDGKGSIVPKSNSADSMDENRSFSFILGSPPVRPAVQTQTPSVGAEPSTTPGAPSPLPSVMPKTTSTPSSSVPKMARSILKPRIITTSPPHAELSSHFQTPNDFPCSPSSQSAEQQQAPHTAGVCPQSPIPIPIRRQDSRATDDGIGAMSGGMSMDKRPTISSEKQEDYRMACLHARTKTFIQNIEEETRIVLACFPAVFSIGLAPPSAPAAMPAGTSAAAMSTSASTTPPVQPTASAGDSVPPTADTVVEVSQAAREREGAGYRTGSFSPLHKNGQARLSTSSLTVPTRKTPSITIQDQSYLAPSPINPLPSALDGGEHLFQSSLDRASDSEDALPYKIGSLPPNATKERRSKSVIFQRTPSVDDLSGAEGNGSGGGVSTSASHPVIFMQGERPLEQQLQTQLQDQFTPPILSVTLSSPPMPSSSPPTSSLLPLISAPSLGSTLLSSTSLMATGQRASSSSYPAINFSSLTEEDEQAGGGQGLLTPASLGSNNTATTTSLTERNSAGDASLSGDAQPAQRRGDFGLGLNVDTGFSK